MSFSVDVLTNVAVELQRGTGHQGRFQCLITTLCQVLECDAPALLCYNSQQSIPPAIDDLVKDVLGRCFVLEGYPQLEAIARAGDMMRFPADSRLSDPYGGLIPGQESLKVHACADLPLFAGQDLIGILTPDRMQPDQFDVLSSEELRLVAALTTGALSNASLIEQLESRNIVPGDATSFEAVKQMQMVGLSPGMTQLKKGIEIVTVSDLNVLISGETGTSEELVARAIHETSPRAMNPPVYLNCAALPESAAESELFGHMKGAFIGAISNRNGKFEMTDNGILFLDKIDESSLALQARPLRVLQYGDTQRVGDDRSLRVDVRVLVVANCGLREGVLVGQFRADLFHRLNVFPLSVPLLRKRGDNIILLAGYFCEQCCLRLELSHVVLSTGTRDLLQHCRFPENVHELEHAIRRTVVLTRATRNGDEVIIEAQHFAFPEVTSSPPETATVPVVKQNLCEATRVLQRETIRQALVRNYHNWAACARTLETGVANLHRLMKRLGLKD